MAPVLIATLSAPARSSTSTSSTDADAAADGQRDEHASPRSGVPPRAWSPGPRPTPRCRGRSARLPPRRRRQPPSSTGSPASRRSTKLTPLTTRPSCTSRHGMTRTATVTTNTLASGMIHDRARRITRRLLRRRADMPLVGERRRSRRSAARSAATRIARRSLDERGSRHALRSRASEEGRGSSGAILRELSERQVGASQSSPHYADDHAPAR